MNLIKKIVTNHAQLTNWRQTLHANPEIAFQEEQTAQFVEQKLSEFGVSLYPRMAGTGIIGSLTSGNSNCSIALRADMDALPVEEMTGVSYCSQNKGMMHACGHDGHTTMLLGAAQYLAGTMNFNGTVYFIFQPAEENEGGGRKLVDEGLFERFQIDEIYAMHNWPNLESGKIALRSGPVMAAYDAFDIIITGKGGHAAAPHNTIDPIVVASQVITALQTITSRQSNPLESVVVSITRMYSGDTYNIIPEQARLSGTVRTFNPKLQDQTITNLKQLVICTCEAFGAKGEVAYQKCYPATINSVAETEYARKAAVAVVGEENVIIDRPPSMGSEDFSFLLNQCKGSYISIGNGDSAGLHSPYYNFNDEILPVGASFWARLTEQQLA